MAEIRIIPRPGFTMTVDVRWARELFEDMERSRIVTFHSNPTTDALYLALHDALKPEEPAAPKAPRTWDHTATWRRLEAGSYVLTVFGVTLARIAAINAGWWRATVYPDGQGLGSVDAPGRVVRMERRSLADAKQDARSRYQKEWGQESR